MSNRRFKPLFLILLILIVGFLIISKNEIQRIFSELRSDYHLAISKRLLNENNQTAALEELKKSVHINPLNKEAWALASKLSEKKDSSLHIEALSHLAVLDQSSSHAAVDFLIQARLSRQIPLAAPLIRKIIDSHPNDPQVLYQATLVLCTLGLYQAAYQLITDARKISPEDTELVLAQSTLELLSNNSDLLAKATAKLEEISKQNTEISTIAILNLITHYKKTNPERARFLLKEALNSNPDNWELRILELDLAYESGDEELPLLFEEAVARANSATRLGDLLARVAEYQNPESAFRLLESLPNNLLNPSELLLVRIPILWRTKDYEQIVHLTKNRPQNLDARTNTHLLLWMIRALKQTDPVTAYEQLNRMIDLLVTRPLLLLECADVLHDWGLDDLSIPILERLADSRGPYAYHALILLFDQAHARGDTVSLFRITDSLLQLQPDNPILLFNYATLSLELGINLPKAERISEKLYKTDPHDAGLAHLYAQALAANGKLEEAVAVYDSLPAEAMRTAPILQPYEALILNKMQKTTDSSF